MAQESLDVQRLVNAKLEHNMTKYKGIRPLRGADGRVRKIASEADLQEAMHSVEEHAAKQRQIQEKVDQNNAAELARRRAAGDPHGTMSQRRRKKMAKSEVEEKAGEGEEGAGGKPQPPRSARKRRQRLREASAKPSVRGLLLNAGELATAAGAGRSVSAGPAGETETGGRAPAAAVSAESEAAAPPMGCPAPAAAVAAATWSSASLAAGVALGAASALIAQSLARR